MTETPPHGPFTEKLTREQETRPASDPKLVAGMTAYYASQAAKLMKAYIDPNDTVKSPAFSGATAFLKRLSEASHAASQAENPAEEMKALCTVNIASVRNSLATAYGFATAVHKQDATLPTQNLPPPTPPAEQDAPATPTPKGKKQNDLQLTRPDMEQLANGLYKSLMDIAALTRLTGEIQRLPAGKNFGKNVFASLVNTKGGVNTSHVIAGLTSNAVRSRQIAPIARDFSVENGVKGFTFGATQRFDAARSPQRSRNV